MLRGADQVPWDGKLKYDYQLWIDSDIVFNTDKFYQLVLMDQPSSIWMVLYRRWEYKFSGSLDGGG